MRRGKTSGAAERAEDFANIETSLGPARHWRPAAYARAITKRSRSNFYYAFLLLGREKRQAIDAVYALARAIDDAVDEAPSPEVARQGLETWSEEVALLAAGTPRHPIARAVGLARGRFPIPLGAIEDLLEGARMDLEQRRYETFGELERYCERVASAIGRMCIEIFGYRSATAPAYARDLGIALQLTNILRDLGSDARRGRLYLPLEDLARWRVTPEDLRDGRPNENLLALLAFQAERARSFYASAERGLAACDRWSLLPAEVMRRIYRSLLDAVERSRFDVFDRRVSLSRSRRVVLTCSVLARTALARA